MKLHELISSLQEAEKLHGPDTEVMVKSANGQFFRQLDVTYDYEEGSPVVLECYMIRGRFRTTPAK